MAIKYELTPLTDRVRYLPGAQNIGVVVANNGSDCAIIDSGLTRDHGKAILKTLATAGLRVRAILNTHSHADHFGGNAYIIESEQAVCVYAPPIEAATIENPVLEPCGLFSGAWPPKSLFGHFLYAPASRVDVLAQPGKLAITEIGTEIEVVALNGHCLRHSGYLVDGVLFAGDLVLSQAVIDKYKVLYCAAAAMHFETLAAMPTLVAESGLRLVLPAHVPPLATADFLALCEANRASFDAILAIIRPYLAAGPRSSEQVVQQVCNQLGLNTTTAEAYYLLNTTIMSLLSYLTNAGYRLSIVDNRPVWAQSS